MSTNFIYANIFNVELSAPVTSTGQTTLTINSTTNAPTITAGQIWVVVLNDAASQSIYEICYATARTGNVLTVLRGQEGTAATTWLAGDNVYAPDTAGILANFALVNGSASQNFAANGLTVASTSTFSGVITTAGIQDSGGTPTFTFLHGNVPLFGVASTNTTGINEIAFGQAAGTTFLGAGTTNFATVNGVTATVLGMGSGALNAFSMNSANAVGVGVIAANPGFGGNLYTTLGSTSAPFLAGSINSATKGMAFGNATGGTSYTIVGAMNNAISTSGVTGILFEIDTNAGALMGIGSTGNMGIAGTAYNNSSSRTLKKNIQPLHFDPLETLRSFKAQSWHVNEQDDNEPLQFGPIAEELPDPIRSGEAGYNNTAAVSLALECLRIVEERLTALETKGTASAG